MSRLFFIMVVGSVAVWIVGVVMGLFTSMGDSAEKDYVETVDILIAARHYEQAETAIVERYPDAERREPDIWLRLGICRSMLEDYDGAIDCFQTGLAIDPDDYRIQHNLALAHDRKGNYSDAEALWLNLKAQAPHFPEVYYHLGRLAEDRGDLERADAYYIKELNLNTASQSAWKRHMMVKKRLDEKPESETEGEAERP